MTGPIDSDIFRVFELSLRRCLSDDGFLARFYDAFLTSDPDVASRFEGVDMKRQRGVLKSSLYLVARAAGGFSDGMQHLRDIASRHGPKGYDIRAEHYTLWLDTLVATASATDPRFDDDIRSAWIACLTPAIDQMRGTDAN